MPPANTEDPIRLRYLPIEFFMSTSWEVLFKDSISLIYYTLKQWY